MKKLTRNALVGTLTGMMVAAVPFAAFAAEEKAEPATAVETTVEAESEACETTLKAESETEKMDFGKMFADMQDMDDEELCKALDEISAYISEHPEMRGELAVAGLEQVGVVLNEEAKAEVADAVNQLTWDTIVEAIENIDMDEVLADIGAELDRMNEEAFKEDVHELDVLLEELGNMLINISEDDIIEFFTF